MASEYTHVVQAKGKAGDWKNMTKHTSQGDAKKALTDAKTSTKGKGEFRITPFDSTPAAKPAAAKAPAAKAAPKAAAKPAARKAK